MSLKGAIRGMPTEGFVPPPRLPEIPLVQRRETQIAEQFGLGSVVKPPPDLEEIAEVIREALGRGRIADVGRREMKYSPLCIWDIDRPFAEEKRLIRGLLEHLIETERRSLTRALAAVYFQAFAADRPGIDLVGQALARMVTSKFGRLYDLQKEYDVFDPAVGPSNVAASCIEKKTGPVQLLRSSGLSTSALTYGFGVAAYRSGMQRFAQTLRRRPEPTLVKAARFWTNEPGNPGYVGANQIFSETVLLPFAEKDPPEDLKTTILDIVIESIGDPRTQPHKWVQMPEAAQIARRWLSRLALRQFLEIVDETAMRQHWDYRRAFWTAFYDKGVVEEAWVAFGPDGALRARRAFGNNVPFGVLKSSMWKQVESGHAVLLLRIGDFTVVDWSHNGRCIIWPDTNPDCPKLYQETYVSGDLAPRFAPSGGMEKTHSAAASYGWQKDVAGFIRKNTGIVVTDRDYRVR